ncbi:ABC transporter ATP-binding protein [Faecalicatena fissicatena]|jgi:ATP-binding cassette subfamily B multidrug efflux pump|uniref:ABC transporter ATP-binding protein n=1 Tax=Faecalicatena fissicatena TaxID=290055 RepID=A0ABX2H0F8_9FIRM|nr:ABC transporter ATP-binding protein [Faecalicatena fissicatena]MCB5868554.1 ABC transporter ATP-binding protein/permease [Faecalicatena fissicatena]NSD83857.1 ABC transporter ATP-binding protein [Faecalicatena fissicatena]NSE33915.1 ABC transporter ATP-binding protein [Faecalicatena fissicatena]NSE56340.1 ABC transporter ATP-binding protein [Faecalicatena fissicatena]NSE65171.1 ABC transporter ATP-binding protein [Faecalicatena fissicatena]
MASKTKNVKRPENMQHTLRIFVSYLGRHKFMLLIVSILVTVSALANLLGTYMIRPVVNNLANGDLHSLAIGVLVAAGIFAIGALAAWGYSQTMVKAAQQVVFDIRRDLFAHMQTLPLRFFDQKRHGDIMSLFTNDIDTIADALNNSFAMAIQSFIQMIGTLVILYILNWKLSLIVTVCYGIMFWYMKFSGAKSKVFYAKQQQSLGELDGYIEEMVSGQKVVKVFNHEQASLQEFLEKNEKLRKEGTGAQSYAATMVPVVVSISYINYAIVAVLGGILAMRGMADVGSLASYLVFVRQAALPINQFTQQSNFLLSALAGAERVFDVMNLEPEVDEGDVTLVNVRKENGILKECQEKTGKWAWRSKDGELTMLRGDVRFENVDFGYTKEHMILKNISLYAKPGQKIAFVGSTGAGKTTITNLINRFYDVQGGTVVYDGIDVRKIKKDALRHSLGIVLQDTHLFTGTVADNIRFGKLDATQEEIEKAARIANAYSFIRRLPDGYDTMVTADGANLSQGQRQLLAIARAAVADPPVLILDEATSSVDTRTEELIEKGMDQLMEGRTVFVIAHRLSTVRNANAIMVLEQGKIVERGDHAELLEQRGKYYQLYHGMFELS